MLSHVSSPSTRFPPFPGGSEKRIFLVFPPFVSFLHFPAWQKLSRKEKFLLFNKNLLPSGNRCSATQL